jgi:RNA polymerase sigma factor (sigma-70 family)
MPQDGRFPRTEWGRIRQAGTRKSSAVRDFVSGYREPLRRFIQSQGIDREETEDLVQDVFAKLFERDLLAAADRRRGRFRSYLLGVTKNVLGNFLKKRRREKRGGGVPVVSLDEPSAGGGTLLSAQIPGDESDEAFDAMWVDNLVQLAFARLRDECARENLPYYRALACYLDDPDASYRSIADLMGVDESQIRNYIHRGKKKLIQYIQAEVSATCSSEEEVAEELRHLSKHFDARR